MSAEDKPRITIEQMVEELKANGWRQVRIGLWRAPDGRHYQGPSQAHRFMVRERPAESSGKIVVLPEQEV